MKVCGQRFRGRPRSKEYLWSISSPKAGAIKAEVMQFVYYTWSCFSYVGHKLMVLTPKLDLRHLGELESQNTSLGPPVISIVCTVLLKHSLSVVGLEIGLGLKASHKTTF